MNDAKSSHVRWFLVFWLFILSSVAFLDRVNIAIAGASIAAAYHFSNVQLGWVFSSFLIGYALLSVWWRGPFGLWLPVTLQRSILEYPRPNWAGFALA